MAHVPWRGQSSTTPQLVNKLSLRSKSLITAKILETKFPCRKLIESFPSILLILNLPSEILEMEFNFSVLAFHLYGNDKRPNYDVFFVQKVPFHLVHSRPGIRRFLKKSLKDGWRSKTLVQCRRKSQTKRKLRFKEIPAHCRGRRQI